MENEKNDKNKAIINLGIGIGAVLITLFMASGEWDVFDFGISLFICLGLVYAVKKGFIVFYGKTEKIIISFMFSCISTALFVSLLSMMAALTFNTFLATIDVRTYHMIKYNNDTQFFIYRISDKTIDGIEAEGYIQESEVDDIKQKIKTLINKVFRSEKRLFSEIELALNGLSNQKIKGIKKQLKYRIDNRSLIYKHQMIWQIAIYILSIILWYQILNYLPKKRYNKANSTDVKSTRS